MKTIVMVSAILASVLIFSQGALAQNKVTKGFKAGLNRSNFHGEAVNPADDTDNDLAWSSKSGLCIGGFLNVKTSEVFSIQPELLYTSKGAKDEDVFQGDKYVTKVLLTYLEIPVLVKIDIPTQGSVNPNLFAGPALAFKLSAKAKAETPNRTEENDLEDVKSTDFSLVFGAGLDFKLGSGTNALILEGRYTLGLSSIDGSEQKSDIKNKAFALLVGFGF